MYRSLNPQQEAYARGVLFERKTKRQAYRDAYPKSANSSDQKIDIYVNRLEKSGRFREGFSKLQKEAEKELNITRDDILRELCSVGFADNDDDRIKTRDKLTALNMIVDILGYKNPQKLDMTVNADPEPTFYLPAKDPEPE